MGKRACLLFLIIVIIILYCISWRPALCGVSDTASLQRYTPSQTPPVNQVDREAVQAPLTSYPTPAASAEKNRRRSQGDQTSARGDIPRPTADSIPPFGYDIFSDPAQGFTPVDQVVAPDDYTLGPGDHLLLNVWGRVDADLDLVVDRQGRVFIPQVGEVVVHGSTLAEAETTIRESMSKVYSNFDMNLTLGPLRSMTIFVFGEVRRPGAYTVSSLTTVFNALYHAGGPNDRGSLRCIRMMRGDRILEEIDFYDFLLNGRRGNDPRLQPGDVVFVPVVGPRATVRGAVKRPGIYELSDRESLTSLFALAGGLTAEAHLERVMIDRISIPDGRQLLDVDYAAVLDGTRPDVPLVDGDDVSVFFIYEIRSNVVWLEGMVRRPGAFERFDSMTVYDLVGGGMRLKPDAYTERADLERIGPNGEVQLIPVELQDVCDGDGDADFLLTDGDRLIVYARENMIRKPTVHIDGLVQKPGQYELLQSMRLSDLIFRAGDLQKNAYLVRAEIARHRPDRPTELLEVDLRDVLVRRDLTQDILLEEDDYVFIRENPEGTGFPMVSLTGQVLFPGTYALPGPDETLYRLFERAGGLTPRAFPEGTIFIRQKISAQLRRQGLEHILIQSQPIVQDSSGGFTRQELLQFDPERMTRIVLDMPSIIKNRGGEDDLVLQDGDQIYVPEIPSGVQLLGAVASPGTIKFRANWKVANYIKEAGGLTSTANKSELRLIRANGQVVSGGSIDGRRVELGDAIFAPPKIKKDTDWLKYLTGATTVVTGVATTWFLIDRIGN